MDTTTKDARMDVVAGVITASDYAADTINGAHDAMRAGKMTAADAVALTHAAGEWISRWQAAAQLDDDALAFLRQNDAFTASLDTLDAADLPALEGYAGHHAGGLFVLWREIDGGLMVKCHDSWGGPDGEGREIVVHVYDADGEGLLVEDGGADVVTYYATAGEAFAAFMDAEATPEQRAAVERTPVGLEARCSVCGETFVPADDDDTVHPVKADGTPCGGDGEILGAWG